MLVKTRAIVLHSVKYGDSQLIVDMFTEELGRIAFVLRMTSSRKVKFRRPYFQNLNILSIEFDYRPNSKLQKLSDARVLVPYVGIPFSSTKLAISLFLSELLNYSTRLEQVNRPLFLFLLDSLEWLDKATGKLANFHILFMLKLTSYLGFSPNIEAFGNYRFFDLVEGCFVSDMPLGHRFLEATEALVMAKLLRLDYNTMHLMLMSHEQRSYCLDVILLYYRLHIPDFPVMKSLGVLKNLYN